MSNEHLDRAIVETRRKLKWVTECPTTEMERTYARGLVAKLLRDMDQPPLDPPAILGWDLAIQVIKRRAGLEGEG